MLKQIWDGVNVVVANNGGWGVVIVGIWTLFQEIRHQRVAAAAADCKPTPAEQPK